MKKRLLSLALVLCMVFTLLPTSAFAADTLKSGTCGDNLTWTLDRKGTLTISGTGEMEDFSNKWLSGYVTTAPWGDYFNNVKSVIIENGSTSIGKDAFYGCNSITSVTIPDSVTSIGDHAFQYCSKLTSIEIPDSVTNIGNYAFRGCSSITSVTIPDSVTSIGKDAFYDCFALESITVSDNNTSYCSEDGVLLNKSKTTLLRYPRKKSDTSYIIPDSVTSIANYAFRGCSNLTSIVVPGNVTSIGDFAFQECRKLTSIEIPDGVMSIGSAAFNCCLELTSIEIPNSITSIADSAFMSCNSLTSIDIPDSVTSIGNYAFEGCRKLENITIPNSVTKIGIETFNDCISLKNISFYGTELEWNNIGCSFDRDVLVHYECYGVNFSETITSPTCMEKGYTTYTCDCGCSYKDNFTDALGHDFVDDTCTRCGAGTVVESGTCGDNLTWTLDSKGTLTISGTGEMADYWSYSYMPWYNQKNGIKSIIISDGVTSICDYAFYYCRNLTSVTIPDSVASIANHAFSGCRTLKEVVFAGTKAEWTAIGYTFDGEPRIHYSCTSLEDHFIPVEIEESTCYSEGYVTYCCDCGYEYTEKTPQNHEYKVISTFGPTCTRHGYDLLKCSKCGGTKIQYFDDELIPHYYEESVVTSNCTTGGYTLHKCIFCGDSYKDKLVKTLGHDYANGACTRCGVKDPTYVAITVQPGDISAVDGKTINFTVAAEGEGLRYQWQYSKNGGSAWLNSGMTGSTTDTLKVKATAARDGQMYRCVITNANGNIVTSDAAKLSVIPASVIEITAQPGNISEVVGKTVCFNVSAEGNDLSYQWQYSKNSGKTWLNSTSASATTNTISVKVTEARDGQMYRCVITDANGSSVISEAATLSIKTAVVTTITAQPEDYYGKANTTAKFEVKAEGEGFTYQWYYSTDEGATWYKSSSTGATTAVFEPVLKSSTSGRIFRCQITDASGIKIYSETARMTIGEKPVTGNIEITEQPEDATVEENSNAFFAVVAEGEDLSYQWQYSKNSGKTWLNSTSASATTDTISVKATAARDGQMYRCIVTDSEGKMTTSDKATLCVKVTSGTCGDNLTWKIDNDGVLTISGSGEMDPYCEPNESGKILQTPWHNVSDSIKTVVVEKSVASIGDGAFASCTSLKNVYLNTSDVAVGNKAFSNCGVLTDVYFSGTEEQWNDISNHKLGKDNDCLINANIIYNNE